MTASEILLQIVLPVGLVVLILLSFLSVFLFLRYRDQWQVKRLRQTLKKERLERLNKTLEKAAITSYNSKQNREQVTLLENAFDEIEFSINETEKAIENWAALPHLKHRKMRLRNLHALEEHIEHSFFLERKFDGISAKVVSQDEHLRSEFILSQNLLRQGLEFYSKRRLLLEHALGALDDLVLQLQELEKAFNLALTRGDLKAASSNLGTYLKRVEHFIIAVDLGPALHSYLYEILPRLISELNLKYKTYQSTLPIVYANRDLAATLRLIAPQFKAARAKLAELDFETGSALVRKILRTVKALERQVDFETYVEALFQANAKEVKAQAEITLVRFAEMRAQFANLAGRARIVTSEINQAYEDLLRHGQNLQAAFNDFDSVMQTQATLLPSAKVVRAKRLSQLTWEVLTEINNINGAFWALNVETAQARRKYQRAESALNEIMASTKRQNVLLSMRDLASFEELSAQLNTIAPQLKKEQISLDVQREITALTIKTVAFYQSASASVQIAEMTANTLREFAHLRALEQKLNLAFSQAENFYLAGQYAEALNLVVTRLEERLN